MSTGSERCSWKWGAHAFGVWFAASRRKRRPAISPNQTGGPDGGYEADGETPSAARETRAIPEINSIVPAENWWECSVGEWDLAAKPVLFCPCLHFALYSVTGVARRGARLRFSGCVSLLSCHPPPLRAFVI